MGYHLTNDEKETIISFDESSPKANIYTFNSRWKNHLEKVLGIKPYKTYECGGREYEIDKKRLPLPRMPRKISEESRKQSGEKLKVARAAKKAH